ncbi:MAG: aminoglycoside phosphotransferase family protein [Thermoactinospora sp.]|nr:aminoglycoside phosphotransferase family protein [Thermoactinospora sp.]
MRDKPKDLDEGVLAAALGAWGIETAGLEHAPVGFGDHHWIATGTHARTASDTRRWFVTAADLGDGREDPLSDPADPGDGREGPPAGGVRGAAFARLGAALETAAALVGLGFVVAPVRALDGTTLRPLGERYALSVFPFVEGGTGDFGDELSAPDRGLVIDLLAELHSTPPPATTPARPLELVHRAGLEQALRETHRPWTGGPYAEPARALLAEHATSLRRTLRDFDRMSRNAGHPVLTHGEPHPGNLLRRGDRFLLVDWDTVGLAAPERDLWLVARGPDDLARYADATGRVPDPAALDLYRLRWSLDDVAEFAGWFRSPHTRTPDTDLAWRSLATTLDHVIRPAGTPPLSR